VDGNGIATAWNSKSLAAVHGRQPHAWLPAIVGHVRPKSDVFDADAEKLGREVIDLAVRA
jgi:hypothetical protein